MGRVVWYELRRSPLFYAAALAVVVELVGLFAAAAPGWSDAWSSASLAVVWPGFIVAALLAGATAMASVARTERGESVMANAAIPRWRLEAAMLLAPVLVSILVYVVGMVVALILTWPQAHVGAGWLRPGFALISWSLAGIGIAAGHLTGRAFPSRVTPPLVAAATFALAVAIPSADGLFFVPLTASTEYRLSALAVVLPVAAALALLVTVALAVQAQTEAGAPPRLRWPFVAVGAVIAVVLLAAAMTVPRLVLRTDSVTPLCTEGAGPSICVYPEAPVLFDDAQGISERAAKLPAGYFTWPEVISQAGLADEDTFSDLGDNWLFTGQISASISGGSGIYCGEETPSDPDAAWASQVNIEEWLTSRLYGGPRPASVHTTADDLIDLPAIADLLQQTEAQQQAWLDSQRKALEVACGK